MRQRHVFGLMAGINCKPAPGPVVWRTRTTWDDVVSEWTEERA